MKRDRASIARAKMSASGRDRKFSPEHRAKLSAAAKARKPPSAETCCRNKHVAGETEDKPSVESVGADIIDQCVNCAVEQSGAAAPFSGRRGGAQFRAMFVGEFPATIGFCDLTCDGGTFLRRLVGPTGATS
jgi:hypothetical protein